ncbi:MAG: hypothetical protein ACK5RF_19705 [Pirellula sp.]
MMAAYVFGRKPTIRSTGCQRRCRTGGSFWVGWGKTQEKRVGQDRLNGFMQLKLDHAKGILEGLSNEDFNAISQNAQGLATLSLESSWNAYTTPEYLALSTDFRRAVRMMTEAASEKNLDRAALAYVNTTVQCIECHRYMRHAKR